MGCQTKRLVLWRVGPQQKTGTRNLWIKNQQKKIIRQHPRPVPAENCNENWAPQKKTRTRNLGGETKKSIIKNHSLASASWRDFSFPVTLFVLLPTLTRRCGTLFHNFRPAHDRHRVGTHTLGWSVWRVWVPPPFQRLLPAFVSTWLKLKPMIQALGNSIGRIASGDCNDAICQAAVDTLKSLGVLVLPSTKQLSSSICRYRWPKIVRLNMCWAAIIGS